MNRARSRNQFTCNACSSACSTAAQLTKHLQICQIYQSLRCRVVGQYTTKKRDETPTSISKLLCVQRVRDFIQVNFHQYPTLNGNSKFLIGTELRVPATASVEMQRKFLDVARKNGHNPGTPPTSQRRQKRERQEWWNVGDEVSAEYDGQWYDAVILSQPCSRTFHLWEVKYLVDHTFNQCTVDEIRPRGKKQKSSSSSSSSSSTTSSSSSSTSTTSSSSTTSSPASSSGSSHNYSSTGSDEDETLLLATTVSECLQKWASDPCSLGSELSCVDDMKIICESTQSGKMPIIVCETMRSRLLYERNELLRKYLQDLTENNGDEMSRGRVTRVAVDSDVAPYLTDAFGVDESTFSDNERKWTFCGCLKKNDRVLSVPQREVLH